MADIPEIIEDVARAIWEAGDRQVILWDEIGETVQSNLRAKAQAAIQAVARHLRSHNGPNTDEAIVADQICDEALGKYGL